MKIITLNTVNHLNNYKKIKTKEHKKIILSTKNYTFTYKPTKKIINLTKETEDKQVKIKVNLNPKKKQYSKPHSEQNNQQTNIFQCPYCDQIITIIHNIKSDYAITCPNCGHVGIIHKKPETRNKDYYAENETKNKLPLASWIYQPFLRAKIFGLLLFAIGTIFLLNPTTSNIKISIMLFFIGGLPFILISEKKFIIMSPTSNITKANKTKNNQITTDENFLQKNKLVISEKISLLIIAATLILFLITKPADLEIFLVLLYLSLLIIKELIDEFTPVHVKQRLNVFVVIFFIIFVVIIAERIITILNI